MPVKVASPDSVMPVLDGFGFLDKIDDSPPPVVLIYAAFAGHRSMNSPICTRVSCSDPSSSPSQLRNS
jgi:hypothetical protein